MPSTKTRTNPTGSLPEKPTTTTPTTPSGCTSIFCDPSYPHKHNCSWPPRANLLRRGTANLLHALHVRRIPLDIVQSSGYATNLPHDWRKQSGYPSERPVYRCGACGRFYVFTRVVRKEEGKCCQYGEKSAKSGSVKSGVTAPPEYCEKDALAFEEMMRAEGEKAKEFV